MPTYGQLKLLKSQYNVDFKQLWSWADNEVANIDNFLN
jgi:hypothetical protein